MTELEEKELIEEICDLTTDLDYYDEMQKEWIKKQKEKNIEFDEDLVQGI